MPALLGGSLLGPESTGRRRNWLLGDMAPPTPQPLQPDQLTGFLQGGGPSTQMGRGATPRSPQADLATTLQLASAQADVTGAGNRRPPSPMPPPTPSPTPPPSSLPKPPTPTRPGEPPADWRNPPAPSSPGPNWYATSGLPDWAQQIAVSIRRSALQAFRDVGVLGAHNVASWLPTIDQWIQQAVPAEYQPYFRRFARIQFRPELPPEATPADPLRQRIEPVIANEITNIFRVPPYSTHPLDFQGEYLQSLAGKFGPWGVPPEAQEYFRRYAQLVFQNMTQGGGPAPPQWTDFGLPSQGGLSSLQEAMLFNVDPSMLNPGLRQQIGEQVRLHGGNRAIEANAFRNILTPEGTRRLDEGSALTTSLQELFRQQLAPDLYLNNPGLPTPTPRTWTELQALLRAVPPALRSRIMAQFQSLGLAQALGS